MTIPSKPLKPMETPDELPVREGYAAWASCYDEDGNPLIALEGPAMRRWFGRVAGRRVLDLGCGTGRHATALVAAGADVVALDFTPEMLARAKRTPALQDPDPARRVLWLRHALPDPMPFPDATFALAVLGLVAEHLDDAALDAALREVARVLAPGGRCLLSALHPDRTAEGQRARFIDPATGLRRPIRTFHRTTDAYQAAATGAGLLPAGAQVLMVPPRLAEDYPRARPYIGRALGWVARWSKPPR
jgi:SAM-dependent methyltransferase